MERAILTGMPGPAGAWALDDDMAELAELARSAGAEVLGTVLQRQRRIDPRTCFPSGKVAELAEAVRAHTADLVLCNCGLSPRQQLHLEEALAVRVIDRTRLILDIFARRAQSHEGRIQVELAQLLYLLPRLIGLGREMSRTGGGIGTRGPGETQLETDRRRVRARIAALRRQLEGVAASRAVQRSGRLRQGLPQVALVGYTNAGKSTLHRALAGAGAHVADQLFATLDPTTRAMDLPGNQRALLTDTVGFVHDLPHDLVAAFSATLEEVTRADLLLEVVDRHHPQRWEQCAAVERVLNDLGAAALPRIVVWNKADLPPEDGSLGSGQLGAPPQDLPQVDVSALAGQGLDRLRALIAAQLGQARRTVAVLLPFSAEGLLSAVHRRGEVRRLNYLPDGIDLEAVCPPELAARLEAAGRPGPQPQTDPVPPKGDRA